MENPRNDWKPGKLFYKYMMWKIYKRNLYMTYASWCSPLNLLCPIGNKHVKIVGCFFKPAFKPLELWVIFGSSSSPQKQSMGVTRSTHIPAVYPIPIPPSQIPPHPNPTIFHISASVYQHQHFGSPPLSESTSDIVKVLQIICQNRIAKTWCSPPARERCSAGELGTSSPRCLHWRLICDLLWSLTQQCLWYW